MNSCTNSDKNDTKQFVFKQIYFELGVCIFRILVFNSFFKNYIRMQNRLAEENSLYLRQHSKNPVDWYPWGEAAFAEARASDRPMLVSIGYSACHWCHVMAHESFENEYIAKLMNQHFVCVKVDREERPDVDQVYMEAVQMIQHSGGWPLNVFCLPDGRPFFGGTYFPSKDIGNGMIPWPQLLMRIADYYKRSKAELEENADSIQKNILAATRGSSTGGNVERWDDLLLIDAASGICGNHDDRYGGFGDAPKFPPALTLNFLRALRNSALIQGNPELGKRIDVVCHTTLRAMALGGLFDQFGGGFARYSVDRHWRIPHFEKMLYDNALLMDAYTRGWLDTHDPLYAEVVKETVEWLEREMSSEGGGFYAALDADSEGKEGHYYVWTPEEIEAALNSRQEAQALCQTYDISAEGNFEDGRSNPVLKDPDISLRNKLAPARQRLRVYREANRSYPGKDTKINTAWNCLLIRALVDAGFYFNRNEWVQRARKAADFIWRELSEEKEGGLRMKAVYYENSGAQIEGFLHDYALAAEAFLSVAAKIDLLDAGASTVYRLRAQACIESALKFFQDPQMEGFYFTADDVQTPVARRKEWFDNALPSGNAAMLHALSGLYALTGEKRYGELFYSTLTAYISYSQKVAAGVAHALEAAATYATGIIIIKIRPDVATDTLQRELAAIPWRRTFIQVNQEEQGDDYQVCIGSKCMSTSDKLAEVLTGL